MNREPHRLAPLVAALALLLVTGCAAAPDAPGDGSVASPDAPVTGTEARARAEGAGAEPRAERAASDDGASGAAQTPTRREGDAAQSGSTEAGRKPGEGAERGAGDTPAPLRPFPVETLHDLLVAELAIRRGHYPEALDRYLAQARESGDARVAARAARLAGYLGNDEQALEAAVLWAEHAPADPRARQHAALALIRAGRHEAALGHLIAVQEIAGGASFGYLAMQAEDADPATRAALSEALATLLERYPEAKQLHFARAVMLEQRGKPQEALASLEHSGELAESRQGALLRARIQQMLERPDAAIEALENAVAAHGEAPRLRYALARLYVERGRLEAARSEFEALLAGNERNPDVLLSLALLELERDRLEAARGYLERLLGTGERVDAARFYLGRIAARAASHEDALEHYRRVAPGRHFAAAQVSAGRMLLEHENVRAVQRWFDEMRGRHASAAKRLWLIEGELLRDAQQLEAAESVLERAIAAGRDDEEVRYARAMIRLERDDLAGFETDLRTVLERNPDSAMALNALGYTLADRARRLEEARALIERAHELQPHDPAIIDSLGWVHFRLGDHQRAVELLRRAWRELPDPEIAAHLGEALWAIDERTAAREVWSRALQEAPEHAVLRQTIRRLLDPEAAMELLGDAAAEPS